VAIVHDKTTYGKGLADETKKAMNAAVSRRRCTKRSPKRQGFLGAGQQDEAGQYRPIYFGGYATERADRPASPRPRVQSAVHLGRRAGDRGVLEDHRAGRRGRDDHFAGSAQVPAAKAIVDRFQGPGHDPEGYTSTPMRRFGFLAAAAEKAKSLKLPICRRR